MPEFAPLQTVHVGDVRVTYLPDGGGIVEPLALYPASTAAGWEKYPQLLDDEGKFRTTIGAYLIQVGDRHIAVDTGMGPVTVPFPGFGPFFGGRYLHSLAATGVARAAVTDVWFTHLHLDHVGWTTLEEDGQRGLTFPNARHAVSRAEWEFWYGGENPAGPDAAVQGALHGRIHHFANGDEVAPGITVVATPGHTPGHVSLLIERAGQRLYILGDVLHGVMQLQEPDWSVAFDVDQAAARATREALYPQLARPDTIVAVNHFSNTVFGRIVPDGAVWRWEPLAG
ncbi:MAG: MBL fold metallo-hydrolase [Anaerolineales bacterium]|nr:MBL fold metallo-hydrolase [Anaerolineales bacterium]